MYFELNIYFFGFIFICFIGSFFANRLIARFIVGIILSTWFFITMKGGYQLVALSDSNGNWFARIPIELFIYGWLSIIILQIIISSIIRRRRA